MERPILGRGDGTRLFELWGPYLAYTSHRLLYIFVDALHRLVKPARIACLHRQSFEAVGTAVGPRQLCLYSLSMRTVFITGRNRVQEPPPL